MDNWVDLATEIMRWAVKDIKCKVPTNCDSRKDGYSCGDCWYSAHRYFRSNLFKQTLAILGVQKESHEFIMTETKLGKYFIWDDDEANNR